MASWMSDTARQPSEHAQGLDGGPIGTVGVTGFRISATGIPSLGPTLSTSLPASMC